MSKQKSKNIPVESFNVFRCDACNKEMNLPEFKDHLLKIHQIGSEQFKGKKQMIMHMDGKEWFSSTYKWTLDTGLTFHQFTQNARRKDDQMRY